MTDQELFSVLDDLSSRIMAQVRAGIAGGGTLEMQAIDALEAVYPQGYTRWMSPARPVEKTETE